MRLCIGGKNDIAVNVCKHIREKYPHLELYVTLNKNDSGVSRDQQSLRKFAMEEKVPVVSLEDIYEWDDLLFLSLEFDRIIKPEFFKSTQLFNIHFSLLPKYRGVYTSAWPILNGEKESGVTLHVIDAGIDSGGIIAQESFPLSDIETAYSLYAKYIRYGTSLVIKWIPALIAMDYTVRRQPEIGGSYYSRTTIDYANLSVVLNQTSVQIDRQVRAYNYRSFQIPTVLGNPILYTAPLKRKSTSTPGTLLKETISYIDIATKDYDLRLFKDRFGEIQGYILKGDIDSIKTIENLRAYVYERDPETGESLLTLAKRCNKNDIYHVLIQEGFNTDSWS